ncbi:aminotransferase class I/II-fold pyridoxal phosphate-dependent enzyme [Psychroflexus maritimus]|uniref:Pyridoxal phosphate-dependent aminotransferase family protein n=1 Tax=Psychroflexus maritimus TaxID=2714865 RepID=A0A967E660_9FLAO|nr:pyridoxal phosphate-dependent aminotransferase family protein [Psychroflexus maritimus]NGZ89421.1 pyridoxal phosphate-dependent aminotransferase family protein [Psychroflexus maritimus]
MRFPNSLNEKLKKRVESNLLRKLSQTSLTYDFTSNDYLGFNQLKEISEKATQLVEEHQLSFNGAGGSRLLSGNHSLYPLTEDYLTAHYKSLSSCIFNSGYTANLGLLSAIGLRNTIFLYDELVHASIRDGMQLSHAKAYKFQHNDASDLERLLTKFESDEIDVFVITEAVFSMDGDGPNLNRFLELCQAYKAYLIIDEAHSNGIFPLEDLLSEHDVKDVFARVVTFGKALGIEGAAVLGSEELTTYLVNFSRSLIYTTALSPIQVAKIYTAHQLLAEKKEELNWLKENISFFRSMCFQLRLDQYFVESFSQIQSCVIPGNDKVTEIAEKFQEREFHVKAIKSPTVPEGQERIRFCLRAYTNPSEMEAVLKLLKQWLV